MEPVFFFDHSDPAMDAATKNAQATFRFFWRELTWEYRRIVPALELAAVKVPFVDPGVPPKPEQMWVGDVEFDGRRVTGKLINQPNWLKSVKQGDPVSVPLEGISDWMYVMKGRAYGGYTVQLLRSQMPERARREHDEAWGFDFGNPGVVLVCPPEWSPVDAFSAEVPPEHPMAVNMAPSLATQLKKQPALATMADERGFTLLHQLALGGTKTGVSILLKHGAKVNEPAGNGLTALAMAQVLGWSEVSEVLHAHGAS